ncbi:MAG: glycoside hydrolase family 140 protein [Bacteroidota bacterium]
MKKIGLTLYICMINLLLIGQGLSISDTQRHLVTEEGKPFLWLGDTAWELFHRLNREEASYYLEKRAEQGFSVIQAVVLAEIDGVRTPNPYGDLPLRDESPDTPNEAYFEHVDFIVEKANERGMYVGMLPTWGDKMYSLHPGEGPIIFTRENAETFGEYLGKRYRDKQIIWILGGDRTVANLEVLEIWRAMAKGLKKGDRGNHLITFHPRGATSSSYWLHNEDWLDFNMYQSGHSKHFTPVYGYAENDYLLHPTKPTVEGEPAYEDIPIEFWKYMDWEDSLKVPPAVLNADKLIQDPSHFKQGFFRAYDVRIHAYWNFLSGAAGYTYGNNAVWQMCKRGGEITIPCLTDWKEALDRPGANDIQHVRTIMESYPVSSFVPDQSVVYGKNAKNEDHIRAAVAQDGSFILVYMAKGQPVFLNLVKLAGPAKVHWFNPREGTFTEGDSLAKRGIKEFIPPSNGVGEDWLLVLAVE